MKLRENRKYTHAIMFHHFHGSNHPRVQGSISGDEFEEIIGWLSATYNLVSSETYCNRLVREALNPNDICLTFDDALLCQIDVAVPILKKRGIKAFFFIYSSPFLGHPDPLEIYRYFRTVEFPSIDEFYTEFINVAQLHYRSAICDGIKSYEPLTFLKHFPFYSENDKLFRYLRDQILSKEEYGTVMRYLMNLRQFDEKKASARLWMNDDNLKQLRDDGHIIGLHSYSHPTMLHKMTDGEQNEEYKKNFDHLYSVLGHKPFAMSHPCGNYSHATLSILKSLGIIIGFRSSNSIKVIRSPLEIPRDDHANILSKLRVHRLVKS